MKLYRVYAQRDDAYLEMGLAYELIPNRLIAGNTICRAHVPTCTTKGVPILRSSTFKPCSECSKIATAKPFNKRVKRMETVLSVKRILAQPKITAVEFELLLNFTHTKVSGPTWPEARKELVNEIKRTVDIITQLRKATTHLQKHGLADADGTISNPDAFLVKFVELYQDKTCRDSILFAMLRLLVKRASGLSSNLRIEISLIDFSLIIRSCGRKVYNMLFANLPLPTYRIVQKHASKQTGTIILDASATALAGRLDLFCQRIQPNGSSSPIPVTLAMDGTKVTKALLINARHSKIVGQTYPDHMIDATDANMAMIGDSGPVENLACEIKLGVIAAQNAPSVRVSAL